MDVENLSDLSVFIDRFGSILASKERGEIFGWLAVFLVPGGFRKGAIT